MALLVSAGDSQLNMTLWKYWDYKTVSLAAACDHLNAVSVTYGAEPLRAALINCSRLPPPVSGEHARGMAAH